MCSVSFGCLSKTANENRIVRILMRNQRLVAIYHASIELSLRGIDESDSLVLRITLDLARLIKRIRIFQFFHSKNYGKFGPFIHGARFKYRGRTCLVRPSN